MIIAGLKEEKVFAACVNLLRIKVLNRLYSKLEKECEMPLPPWFYFFQSEHLPISQNGAKLSILDNYIDMYQ